MNRDRILITSVNSDNHKDVKNICKNKGIRMNDFLRPIIMDLIDSSDERLKLKPKNKKTKHFGLSNIITKEKNQQLTNICDNIGVCKSAYLKIKIAEELLKYPSYMKNELK